MADRCGWLDVDAMLDQMSREQFEERYQAYLLSGAGEHYERQAQLITVIANLLPGYFRATGSEVPDSAFRRVTEFLPKFLRPKTVKPAAPDPEDLARRLGCL